LGFSQLLRDDILFCEALRHLSAKYCFHIHQCSSLSQLYIDDLKEVGFEDIQYMVLSLQQEFQTVFGTIFAQMQKLVVFHGPRFDSNWGQPFLSFPEISLGSR
jgi:hypothetical protein